MADARPTLLFVTKSDLTGESGHNIITRNIALAFARSDAVETVVVCPEPAGDLPTEVTDAVDEFVHLRRATADPSIPDRFAGVVDAFRTVRRAVRRLEPDLMVARVGPDTIAPPVVASRYDVPYVALARGTSYRRLRFSTILTRIFGYNVRTATEVYTASTEIKADADRMRRPDQREAVVLSNAVDTTAFQPHDRDEAREAIGLEVGDDFVVGFVGSMKPYHRIDALVRALQHVEDAEGVHLLLVGDGPELERYRQVAEETGVADRVHCPGFVDHADVDQYVSACDALYAVRGREQQSATPVKVFEYLACERPVITRELEDLAFVGDLDVGRTVPGPEPEAVAGAIADLRSLDPEQRHSMGRRGREYVERERTWDAFAQRVLDDALERPQ